MTLDPPGFFGKVPARGDFLSRRVPEGVAAQWDTWLAGLTRAVKEEAGADWPEAWLTAPLWHFALGSGVAPSQGAAGVLIASVDRVGRMFPFTLIGPAHGIPAQAWCDAAEGLILSALDDGFDPDVLDAALQRLGAPDPGEPLGAGDTLWRCQGSDRVGATTQVRHGLPGRADAVAMVLG